MEALSVLALAVTPHFLASGAIDLDMGLNGHAGRVVFSGQGPSLVCLLLLLIAGALVDRATLTRAL